MRVIVIGEGLGGLTAAIRLAQLGVPATIVTFGRGGLWVSPGYIDLLGYAPDLVDDPFAAIPELTACHPYRVLGVDAVKAAAQWFAALTSEYLCGDITNNYLLPSAIGVLRPTALAPDSFAAADAKTVSSYAVVGVNQVKDFQAGMVAGNLARTKCLENRHFKTSLASISFIPRPGENDPTSFTFHDGLTQRAESFGQEVREVAGEGEVVLLPGVLVDKELVKRVQDVVGRPIAEVAMQSPAPAGPILAQAMIEKAKALGVRRMIGTKVVGLTTKGSRVSGVKVQVAGRLREISAQAVIYAPGGFESGALSVDSYGQICETGLGLPLTRSNAAGLVTDNYQDPQPLFEVGVAIDENCRVLDDDGPIYPNLYAVGGIVANAQRWIEKSGDGIALATGFKAGEVVGHE